ncbi:hypothetical protein NPIL_665191 [Nephila pilipes]|uniref:Uncharacterized protein n=1 Tax=Nephila pilipes TaxID=299642 RepID=A0A8X6MFA0_NEPPI|nr:hypothetical protein NPIL_665191 [Nephila pilipes]
MTSRILWLPPFESHPDSNLPVEIRNDFIRISFSSPSTDIRIPEDILPKEFPQTSGKIWQYLYAIKKAGFRLENLNISPAKSVMTARKTPFPSTRR